jgi:hypothetical protein
MAERVNNYPDLRDNNIANFEDLKHLIRQGNENALKGLLGNGDIIPAAPNDDPHLPEGEGYYSEALAHTAAKCGNIRILTMLREINPVSFDYIYEKDVKTVIDDANTHPNIKIKLNEWYANTYRRNN